jgi:hypothetical protein
MDAGASSQVLPVGKDDKRVHEQWKDAHREEELQDLRQKSGGVEKKRGEERRISLF